MTQKQFLIWFTGFWEGEGWFSINPKARGSSTHKLKDGSIRKYRGFTMAVMFGIAQTGLRGELICRKIQKFFNCGYVMRKKQYELRYKPMFQWRIRHSMQIYKVISMILPYLQCRKHEVQDKFEILRNYIERKGFQYNLDFKENFKQRELISNEKR